MLPKRFPPPGPPSRPRGTRVGRGMAAPSPAAEREPAGQQDRRRGARPVRAGRCAPPLRRQVRRRPGVYPLPAGRCGAPPRCRQVRAGQVCAPSVQAGARRRPTRPHPARLLGATGPRWLLVAKQPWCRRQLCEFPAERLLSLATPGDCDIDYI